jgi:HEPN domain-containing protein
VTRKELEALSRIRLREAEALARLGMSDGAYYLAGYCVECALKACIAKATQRQEFPDKKPKRIPSTLFAFAKILSQLLCEGIRNPKDYYYGHTIDSRYLDDAYVYRMS